MCSRIGTTADGHYPWAVICGTDRISIGQKPTGCQAQMEPTGNTVISFNYNLHLIYVYVFNRASYTSGQFL